MSNSVRVRTAPAPMGLAVAAAALLAAGLLAMPQVTFAADLNHAPATTIAQATPGAAPGSNMRTRDNPENVDQRIDSLKTQLKITPSEESAWNAVAAAMRENAQSMRTLIDRVQAENAASRTAVQDLETYERFARAHEDGVRKLTVAFTRLYDTMPAAQKKNADAVFNSWQQRHEMRQTGEEQQPARPGQPG